MSSLVEDAMRAFLKKKEEYDALAEEGQFGYVEQYAMLCKKTLQYRDQEAYCCSDGEMPYNIRKNRYKDIVPYNFNRVKLTRLNEMPGTDYINASYVKGPVNPKQYIAAQGPLPNTVKDFWRMIWEQRTNVIVMACAEYEGYPPKHRCERYWPNSTTESLTFDQISVSLEKEIQTEFADYVIREMHIECSRQVHKVYQLHYIGWPDHGVPNDVSPVLDMIAKSHQYQTDELVPYVVHCSAGCGRTGTLIVIDYAYSMLKGGKLSKDFNLFDVVDDMRKQRPSMVQSVDQYRFAYSAVAELFLRHISMMTKHPYENVQLKPSKSQKPVKNSAAPSVQTSSSEKPSDETTRKQKPPLPCQKPAVLSSKPKTETKVKPAHPVNKPKPGLRESCVPSTSVTDIIEKFNEGKPPLKHKADIQVEQKTHSPVEKDHQVNMQKSALDSYSTVTIENVSSTSQPKCLTVEDIDSDGYVVAKLDDSEGEDCEMVPQNEHSSEIVDSSNPYAYVDPLAHDKWPLQHYAIKSEVNTEGQYVEVANNNASMSVDYGNFDEEDSSLCDISEDEDVPEVPKRNYSLDDVIASGKKSSPHSKCKALTLQKCNNLDSPVSSQIGFPNRPKKPKGPRDQKSKSAKK